MTLLSVLFGLDVAFVVFHNTLRVVLIYVGLPFVLARTWLADRNPRASSAPRRPVYTCAVALAGSSSCAGT